MEHTNYQYCDWIILKLMFIDGNSSSSSNGDAACLNNRKANHTPQTIMLLIIGVSNNIAPPATYY